MMKTNGSDDENSEEPKPVIGSLSIIDTKHRYFVGKDYSNLYEKDFEMLENFGEG